MSAKAGAPRISGSKVAVLIGPQMDAKTARELKKIARVLNADKGKASADNFWILAVDGGLDFCARFGLRVDCAVGDWDSLKRPELLKRLGQGAASTLRVDLPRDKDRSDFHHALKQCGRLKCDTVHAYGFIGGRMDHEWAVFLEAQAWVAKKSTRKFLLFSDRAHISILSPAAIHGPGAEGLELDLKQGATWSLFTLEGRVSGLTIQGAKYSVKNVSLMPSSQGLSNESVGKKVRVTWKRGILTVLVPGARESKIIR